MTSSGLKRPLDFELTHQGSSSGVATTNVPLTFGNKRRCINQQQQQLHQQQSNQHHHHQQQQQHNHHHHQHQHHNHHHQQQQQQRMDNVTGHNSSPFKDSSALLPLLNDQLASLIKYEIHDKHGNQSDEPSVLTARQALFICEKLIRGREQKLREEYDRILNSKLAEQHEIYVKYTQDHIEKRFNDSNSHQSSYLS